MSSEVLSPERMALLKARLARRAAPADPVPRLTGLPRTPATVLPLSHQQEELWFLQRLAPESTAYNTPVLWRIAGSVDQIAVSAALSRLTARHEVLRTSFPERDGEPVQQPHPPAVRRLKVRRTADREATDRLVRRAGERPFDLTAPGLLRPLLALDPDGATLLLDLHHIASDEWSERVLWRDFRHFYLAERGPADGRLPELPVQFADYAAWQRDRLRGERLDRLTAHWRSRLGGLAPLRLPLDRPRPRTQTFGGAVHTFDLPSGPAAGLAALARAHGATPFMAYLAVFVLLLSRVSGQDDVTVGTITSGRDHPHLRDLVGFFVGTLALRTGLHGAADFPEVLRRVRATVLDAQAHEALPFRKVVEAVRPPRTPGVPPLVQVLYSYTAAGREDARELAGAEVTTGGVEMPVARFDLVLNVWETPTGALAAFEYNTALFRERTVRRLAGLYGDLLRRICAAPGTPLNDIREES
ncbi:condensation domain-containing protein [Streptomyces sp. NPDC059783]|uniref:condensation domain-containing protein n=1 Tax=Streptomyces sp. NPDC059783 TaxID=3346944 RepID=UPI003660D7E6